MSDTFKIVFDGEIAEGQNLAAVQEKLLKLYKGNQQAVHHLFTGGMVVVKAKLNQQTAMKYKAAFGQAGAVVKIIPEAETTQLTMERPVPPEQAPSVNKAIGNTESFPNHSSQPDKPKAQPGSWLNAAAVVIVLAIFACLGLRFWASNGLDSFVSIDHVAANQDKVVIHAAGALYLHSHSGRLEQRIDLNELGITGQLADLEILDDGSLLIGDMEMKTILRCNPQSKTCEPFAPTGVFTLGENFKFLVDQPRQQLYIADTNNHRLIIQNLADSTCLLARTDSQLSYPNDMVRDDGEMLYLCDTNKFRVIPLKVSKDSVMEIGDPLTSSPFLSADLGDLRELMNDPEKMKAELQKIQAGFGQMMDDASHAKPFALATGPDNNLWIAQLNTVMTSGTINILSPTGERVGKVALDEGAVPVDIIRLNHDFLVVDAGLVRAYTIDSETHFKKDFGDDSFQNHLADIYSRRALLEGTKSLGLIGTIIFAIGAFAVMIVAKIQGVA